MVFKARELDEVKEGVKRRKRHTSVHSCSLPSGCLVEAEEPWEETEKEEPVRLEDAKEEVLPWEPRALLYKCPILLLEHVVGKKHNFCATYSCLVWHRPGTLRDGLLAGWLAGCWQEPTWLPLSPTLRLVPLAASRGLAKSGPTLAASLLRSHTL